MTDIHGEASVRASKPLGAVRRRPIPRNAEDLVMMRDAPGGGPLPGLVVPTVPGVALAAWIAEYRPLMLAELNRRGALLFRGFRIESATDLATVAGACAISSLMSYSERSSPRRSVGAGIYTSTEYPASQPIFLHNENSYAHGWPRRLCFSCVVAAEQGGATPLADTRGVLRRIEPAVARRFADRGVLYVRRFGGPLGLHWRDVFQVDTVEALEREYRRFGYVIVRGAGERLTTRRRGQAIIAHPDTGEQSWFNHAAFFHRSTLAESIDAMLHNIVADEDLPADTFYGDGQPIEPDVIAGIRDAYRCETVRFAWEVGDVLLIDNLITAHGRDPFVGRRVVHVAMLDPMSVDERPASPPAR
jgi:alpha-ketoglutarate-dependent taurine dioxygenase